MISRERALSFAAALAVLPLLLAASCGSSSAVQATRLKDGSFRLRCEKPLAPCLYEAEAICRGKPYTVLSARDERDRYGPELGPSQIEVRRSEAHLRCGAGGKGLLLSDEDGEREAPEGGAFRLTRPPASVAPAPAAPAAPPARACVPGATQACIGPAACPGGQSCLPDGSGFGACDCGTAAAAVGAAGVGGSGGGPLLSGRAGAGARAGGAGSK